MLVVGHDEHTTISWIPAGGRGVCICICLWVVGQVYFPMLMYIRKRIMLRYDLRTFKLYITMTAFWDCTLPCLHC